MDTLSPLTCGQILNTILRENRGNILSEALCVGIEQALIFYLTKHQERAEEMLRLAQKEKESNNA